MNFREGAIAGGPSAPVFRSANGAVEVPLAAANAARAAGAARVTLGIRPESVELDGEGPLRGEVLADEYLGSARCIHVATAAGTIVARTAAGEPARIGASVGLALDPARIRLFDAATGRRLA
jgi:multiple sugar transport system ATP-binding protein